MSDQFGGLDLYQGAVRGMRAFDVDSLGRLRGVTHDAVWLPGENQSEHRDIAGWFGPGTFTMTTPSGHVVYSPGSSKATATNPKGHDFASCRSCGFYAYFGNENQYAKPGRVSGVIEGYGVVHLGTNGFRAQKAKVVALLASERSHMSRFDILARRYTDNQLVPSGFGLCAAAILGGLGLESLGLSPWLAVGFMLSLVLVGIWVFVSGFRAIGYQFSNDKAVDLKLIRRNYPDVKIYRSRRAMLRDFPTHAPEPPSPATAEDFWTREVNA